MNATVDFMLKHPNIRGDNFGIIGFCMGGRVVWLMATANSHLKAAVPYYGAFIMEVWGKAEKSPFELTGGINCPMLFHFGELDTNPSPEDMVKLDAELTRLGKNHQFYTYTGAHHSLLDHTSVRYHKEAAETSWSRTLEFFATHLKGAAERQR